MAIGPFDPDNYYNIQPNLPNYATDLQPQLDANTDARQAALDKFLSQGQSGLDGLKALQAKYNQDSSNLSDRGWAPAAYQGLGAIASAIPNLVANRGTVLRNAAPDMSGTINALRGLDAADRDERMQKIAALRDQLQQSTSMYGMQRQNDQAALSGQDAILGAKDKNLTDAFNANRGDQLQKWQLAHEAYRDDVTNQQHKDQLDLQRAQMAQTLALHNASMKAAADRAGVSLEHQLRAEVNQNQDIKNHGVFSDAARTVNSATADGAKPINDVDLLHAAARVIAPERNGRGTAQNPMEDVENVAAKFGLQADRIMNGSGPLTNDQRQQMVDLVNRKYADSYDHIAGRVVPYYSALASGSKVNPARVLGNVLDPTLKPVRTAAVSNVPTPTTNAVKELQGNIASGWNAGVTNPLAGMVKGWGSSMAGQPAANAPAPEQKDENDWTGAVGDWFNNHIRGQFVPRRNN